jgi:protein-S-isoprenylcysteine O-methyltransferase Ste14
MEKKRKIIPPVYLLGTLVLMWLCHRYVPVYQYIVEPAVYSGIILVFCGITVAAVSAGMFKVADTGLEPFSEATVLVTGGFFRVTRNPMYMGMFLMLAGVAILMGSVGAVLPVPVFVLIIRNNFVLAEERFMESVFGQPYLDYKSKVRRWI